MPPNAANRGISSSTADPTSIPPTTGTNHNGKPHLMNSRGHPPLGKNFVPPASTNSNASRMVTVHIATAAARRRPCDAVLLIARSRFAFATSWRVSIDKVHRPANE